MLKKIICTELQKYKSSVASHESIEGAAENKFDYHAPIKTIHIRKNYCPHLTEEAKTLQHERNTLQEEAVLLEEFEIKSKEAKKAVTKDKKFGQERELGEQVKNSQ